MKPYEGEIAPLPGYLVNTAIDGVPDGYPEPTKIECRVQGGSVDMVNGLAAAGREISATTRLSVLGWLAVSVSDGVLPDKTFVVLTDATGHRRFWRTRTSSRPDVASAFHRPALVGAGFNATIDTGAVQGKYVLGLAREYGGGIQQCSDINVAITIGEGQ